MDQEKGRVVAYMLRRTYAQRLTKGSDCLRFVRASDTIRVPIGTGAAALSKYRIHEGSRDRFVCAPCESQLRRRFDRPGGSDSEAAFLCAAAVSATTEGERRLLKMVHSCSLRHS